MLQRKAQRLREACRCSKVYWRFGKLLAYISIVSAKLDRLRKKVPHIFKTTYPDVVVVAPEAIFQMKCIRGRKNVKPSIGIVFHRLLKTP